MADDGCRRRRFLSLMLILLSSACAFTTLAQQPKVKRSGFGSAINTDDTSVDDARLRLHYSQMLMTRIRANWTHVGIVAADAVCPVKVRQIPGGEVISVEVMPECPYDDVGRRSVEAAILKSQPLPYEGFERVFSGALVLRFRASGPD